MDGEEVFGFLTIFSAQKSDLNDSHKIVFSLLYILDSKLVILL